ncbi:Gfo/Idh/MocA family protein [Agarilytica rhodophyticola]|uniref:Gfo/Idh/MocA family protein n=1 Tax=Agarilytica rhodophyticola TaxID=1737490 RepID=UPI000B3470E1|nr:Gfo/Idh/MocA family oxidoreductase [Agarilytica rhodophyticola]
MNNLNTLRWGILGAGIIAHKLAKALSFVDGVQLVAAASKTPGKAHVFSEKYKVDAHTDYESLVNRSDIDVIYIATTHNFHYENAVLALEAGKHILIEKPFTVNAKEAKNLVALAREKNVFLMEAVWTRFLPSIQLLKTTIEGGIIGDVKYVNISFCNIAPEKYIKRILDPALAGGATLDVGVYPLSFSNFLLGQLPSKVQSLSLPAPTGVDELATYQLQYPLPCLTAITVGFNLYARPTAMIYGSKGYIEFTNFQQGEQFTAYIHNGNTEAQSEEVFKEENHSNGFIYQVLEVLHCIRDGKNESDIMPLAETIATMEVMDNMRNDWGLRYPFE